jgi:DNA-binding NarL/FixJ family response regulator
VTKGVVEATGRLLVVDWHPVVLKGLAAWISHEPYVELVGVASNCEDALDMADELYPNLVLLGYSTPDMGGIEATRRLVAMHGDTRIVLIGVSGGSERKAEAVESGAMDYVLLDTPPWEIAAILRRLVNECSH